MVNKVASIIHCCHSHIEIKHFMIRRRGRATSSSRRRKYVGQGSQIPKSLWYPPHLQKCNCDDEKLVVTCIRADLMYMPNTLNPGLRTIVYKYNRFPTVDVSLNFLTELSFSKSKKDLIDLNLENNKITQINNLTFYGLSNLQVLNFRSNNVEALEGQPFLFAKRLQKINFARNRISRISNTSFVDLPDLRILNLENNLLTSIPTDAFKPLVDLAELYLSGNPFISIPDGSFATFRSLIALDLSSCRLTSLSIGSFQGLGTLRKLKLSDNELKSIPDGAIRDSVPNLEELYIGPESIHFSDFIIWTRSAEHLEHVVISENRHLKAISEVTFGDDSPSLMHLRHFDLAENGLETLSEALLPNWLKIKVIDLTGNPWRCDCETTWLPLRNVERIYPTTENAMQFLPRQTIEMIRHFMTINGSSFGSGNSGDGGGPPEETLIVIISVASVVSVLILNWFFKEYRWKASSPDSHREYAKTPYDDDFFFHNNAQNYQYSTGRSIPVTEL
ncbi:unnamed protein product [Lepeophtheirus salmonis]|uniref:(salmon louse) hypothetical protein n=1 Tax=Lepeophtheirus salmonis TaxID=72036 RepID=A0A7R8CW88_LEPSM|nr:unnamed protein product [Lepeophtheirus salmonis]CAF2918476.1 unnamed protein product [Lepeophtheirus salmonis]